MIDKTDPEYLIKEIAEFKEFYSIRPVVSSRMPTLNEMTSAEADDLIDLLERLDKCLRSLTKIDG